MPHQGAAQRARSGRPCCLFGNCPNDGSHGNCFHISLPDTFRPHGSGDGFRSPLHSGPSAAVQALPWRPRRGPTGPACGWAAPCPALPCPRWAPEPGQLVAHRSPDTQTRAIPLTAQRWPQGPGSRLQAGEGLRPGVQARGSPALAWGWRRGPSRVGRGSRCGPTVSGPPALPATVHGPSAQAPWEGLPCWPCHVAPQDRAADPHTLPRAGPSPRGRRRTPLTWPGPQQPKGEARIRAAR